MGILDIDLDNMTVTTERVKDRNVWVIDNFYRYPNAVASLFNDETTFDPAVNVSFYPGNRIDLRTKVSKNESEQHLKQLQQILLDNGLDKSKIIITIPPEMVLSVFDENEAKKKWIALDEFNGLVVGKNDNRDDARSISLSNSVSPLAGNAHVDSRPNERQLNSLACTCYLSKQSHGGTGLYYNKQLQTYCTSWEFYKNDLVKLIEKCDKASSDEEKIKTIISHRNERIKADMPSRSVGMASAGNEYWELLHFFPMKFNRMVIYDADLYHSISIDDFEFWRKNKRITSNYFIPIYWQDENGQNICPTHYSFDLMQRFYESTISSILSLKHSLQKFRKKFMSK